MNDLGAQAIGVQAQSSDGNSMMNQRALMVHQFALFSGIPLADCSRIISTAQERQYPRRKTIFFEGDPVRQVTLLTSGCVKVTQLSPSGHEVILRLNGPGDMVGAGGACTECTHCSTARTLQPSTALVWESAQFEAVSERFPLLQRNIAHILERSLINLEERFRELCTEKVAPRLSGQLVRLLNQVGKPVNGHVEIMLSRRELAQLTGTTLFTVSRLLCQWEVRGIVSARREVVLVRNVPALIELSRGE